MKLIKRKMTSKPALRKKVPEIILIVFKMVLWIENKKAKLSKILHK
jgi:hypothetical protein